MELEYIVVQAGGKGTRLEHLTANKPKALVPVENLPMLFHLFKKFPTKKFIIIGDYKKEVLREYLESFASVQYQLVEAQGTGTCSGVKNALKLLPNNKPYMLIWSDLILTKEFKLPEYNEKNVDKNYIGVSQSFSCRWSYQDNKFMEEPSFDFGVAGLFVFPNKNSLKDVPDSGELVRWISENGLIFDEIGLSGTREFGIFSEYKALEQEKCRPFNKIDIENGVLIKSSLDLQGEELAVLEKSWYKFAKEKGVSFIPEIYDFEPHLKMEEIKGKNVYEYNDNLDSNLLDSSLLDSNLIKEKREILEKLVENLKKLHKIEQVEVDTFSIKEAYYYKTMNRLEKVRNLIPFANEKTIEINGKLCKNIFFYKREFEKALENISCNEFSFIHGDCTFSNTMLREDNTPVLIDPRGYFGFTKIYGDANYDWAKMYYSIVGNYDRFNLRDFSLKINDNNVEIDIASNGWESLEDYFFELSNTDRNVIKLLHAVIWLSLTTYAWQDYDSVCGAFYNGLYYLEDVIL